MGIPKDWHSSKPSDRVVGVLVVRGVFGVEVVEAGVEELDVGVAGDGTGVEGVGEVEVALALEGFGLG